MTSAAEQFGTNIRATVTTTVPNFVRGSVPLINLLFVTLSGTAATPRLGILVGAGLTGVIILALALWAITGLKETFGKEIAFEEVL
jgi:predicted membrane-bound spermidine synthase